MVNTRTPDVLTVQTPPHERVLGTWSDANKPYEDRIERRNISSSTVSNANSFGLLFE